MRTTERAIRDRPTAAARRHARAASAIAFVLLLGYAPPAPAAVELGGEGKASLYADFRLRLEADWDSQNAAGIGRDDRNRARVRVRVGVNLTPAEGLELGVRVRGGAEGSHQSPHITVVDFDGNDTGAADFNLDKWYFKATRGRGWAWVGRNSLPFWRPDEFAFDDDVTPAGLAAGYEWGGQEGKVTLTAGYFTLPVGMAAFAGNLTLAQVVYQRERGQTGLTLAGGLLGVEAEPGDPDAGRLLNGNGLRDYQTWIGSAQLRRKVGDLPLAVSASLLHNAESYSRSDPAPFTAANFDQTDGWSLSAQAGSLKEQGDRLYAYYYAHIETFAVSSSYAQDDWLRWGSATETRATNMKGHEFRFAYALSGAANLVARLYLVDAITTIEDGNRLRLDLNLKF